jgi:hypothetical protein
MEDLRTLHGVMAWAMTHLSVSVCPVGFFLWGGSDRNGGNMSIMLTYNLYFCPRNSPPLIRVLMMGLYSLLFSELWLLAI